MTVGRGAEGRRSFHAASARAGGCEFLHEGQLHGYLHADALGAAVIMLGRQDA